MMLRKRGPATLAPVVIAAVAAAALFCGAGGCGSQEPSVSQKTVAQIDAEIRKVQADPAMPPQARGIVLGNLQRERAAAAAKRR